MLLASLLLRASTTGSEHKHIPVEMPRLESSVSGWTRLKTDLTAIVSPATGSVAVRASIVKSILLRSVRIGPSADSSARSIPVLPLRIRPAFVVLNVLDLIFLGVLGFHPSGQAWIRLNDKVLHFICFFFATALFYMIWDVDESARGSWLWRNASLILTFATCFIVGGIGSEIVQSLLPYKQFQLGDIIANLFGSSLGLFFSYHIELSYRARREIERLYAPLDIEDYGDLDDEEGSEDNTASANKRPKPARDEPRNSSTAALSAASSKKKVHFGNDIWDDSVEFQSSRASSPASQAQASRQHSSSTYPPTAHASNPSGASADPSTHPRRKPEELFTIDDDDDGDNDPTESPWKDAARS